jgi:hypothetical protein
MVPQQPVTTVSQVAAQMDGTMLKAGLVLSYHEEIKVMKNSGKELKNHHSSQSVLL